MSQGIYWLLTIPHADYTPYPRQSITWERGQLERGESGYIHWQILVAVKKKCRLGGIKILFGTTAHCELARSDAAADYVWKDDTRIEGTQYEFGRRPMDRKRPADWELVKKAAIDGNFSEIPADIFVRCYSALKQIKKDHLQPVAMERTIFCFWGRTGTGKSRRAWDEAQISAYPKDPCTKFWDGYQDQQNVVIDEFRGAIGISHLLRWLDRYPVIIEAKHGATVLRAERIWITSNLNPRHWYPDIGEETLDALLRRMEITEFI